MQKKKILIIHLFVWAHYKAKIYSDLYSLILKDSTFDLKVVQLSINEGSRTKMGQIDWSLHQYPMHILYRDVLERTPTLGRFFKLFKWIITYKPDIVNVQGYFDPAMNLILLYCKLVGIKVIMASDSTELDNPNVGWRESIKSFLVRKSDGFFCYGSKSAEYMLKLGAQKEQIFVANNAVDNHKIEAICKSTHSNREEKKQEMGLRKYNFIFVGRLIPLKNISILLKAYKTLLDTNQNQDWGVIVVGNGDEESNMKAYCIENKLDGVIFVPGQSWYEVPKWFALADVFLLLSFSEAWGLVANEAMVCKLPVIISDRCGCSADLVVEEKNGFIFDPYSVDDLMSKMAFFMKNPHVIQKMGISSYEIIRNFSSENVASEMLNGFKKVLETV